MNIRPLLSLPFLVAASAALLLSAGIAHAGLGADGEAHRACLARFESVSRAENLALEAQDTYIAPQVSAHNYHYFFNAVERGDSARQYRVECDAARAGRVSYFALEPGRWVFEAPRGNGIAAR